MSSRNPLVIFAFTNGAFSSLAITLGATTDALMWCTIELNLGIFGGCVTAIRPFARRYFPRLLGLSSGVGYSSQGQSRSRKHGHPLASITHSERNKFSTNGANQYTTTLTTLRGAPDNDSEEHILSSIPHNATGKEGELATGIIRTVEFDVENSSTAPAP